MKPQYIGGNIRANCPDCGGAISNFESSMQGRPLGGIEIQGGHVHKSSHFQSISYMLVRCTGCNRGGLAKVHFPQSASSSIPPYLEWFFPTMAETIPLPRLVPESVRNEFQEAEKCAGAGAWRAASAMLRSGLEKMLLANGYTRGSLKAKIDDAAKDHVITQARMQRAHDEIRVLGNDIMHDEWRVVTQDEYELAHHYVQRIAEDFYDDRASVEKILQSVGKLQPPVSPMQKPS